MTNKEIDHPKKEKKRVNPYHLTGKQRVFSEEYAKHLNGTKASKAVYDAKNDATHATIASENLRKPKIRAYIHQLLRENEVEVNDIIKVHKRNMEQTEHLPTSQRAVEGFEEMLGLKEKQERDGSVNIAFIIEK